MFRNVLLIPAKELVIEFHAFRAFSFVEIVHVELSEGSVPVEQMMKNWSV
jgi:hypothetical protein